MKFLKKIFHLPTPVELGKAKYNALPMDFFSYEEGAYTWEKWREEVKALHPIKYFFAETLTHWWAVKITRPIEEFFYWIRCNTYNKYHLLDLRQPHTDSDDDYKYGWIDECRQLVLANFTILANHYESRARCKYKFDATPQGIKKLEEEIESAHEDEKFVLNQQLNALKEMSALYQYWTVDRKVMQKEASKLLSEWYKNKRAGNVDGNEERFDAVRAFEEKQDKLEEEMLIRLIKIRGSLWI